MIFNRNSDHIGQFLVRIMILCIFPPCLHTGEDETVQILSGISIGLSRKSSNKTPSKIKIFFKNIKRKIKYLWEITPMTLIFSIVGVLFLVINVWMSGVTVSGCASVIAGIGNTVEKWLSIKKTSWRN